MSGSDDDCCKKGAVVRTTRIMIRGINDTPHLDMIPDNTPH